MTSTTSISPYLQAHLEQIDEAAARIAPYIRRTPLLTTDLAPDLVLKPENFQLTGSFKARGAFNAILKLVQQTNTSPPQGVLTVSSGNHAQAVAAAARAVNLPATILIPEDANPAKIAATRALGATVITEGVTFANREERLQQAQAETGYTVIHPFDNWDIIHGQATAAREILEDAEAKANANATLNATPITNPIATIVTPTGGGGLLTGTALQAKAVNPQIKVIGVEPERADDAARTLKTKQIQKLPDSPNTIADGVRTVAIGARNFEVIVTQQLVDDIVTVTEEEIAEATRQLWLKAKLAVEPTAGLPLAAYLANKLPPNGHDKNDRATTALILSGGNFNPTLLSTLLAKQ